MLNILNDVVVLDLVLGWLEVVALKQSKCLYGSSAANEDGYITSAT
jgi:hypothetical protein